jgi:uncharacterized protein YoxC
MNWLPYANFGLTIVLLVVSCAGFIKIMRNDLTHLQKAVDELKTDCKHIFSKVNGLCQRVSRLEGKLEK